MPVAPAELDAVAADRFEGFQIKFGWNAVFIHQHLARPFINTVSAAAMKAQIRCGIKTAMIIFPEYQDLSLIHGADVERLHKIPTELEDLRKNPGTAPALRGSACGLRVDYAVNKS